MENVFHFQGKRRLSSTARQFTIQPCASDNESQEDNSENEELKGSPFIIKKKSHFYSKKGLSPERKAENDTENGESPGQRKAKSYGGILKKKIPVFLVEESEKKTAMSFSTDCLMNKPVQEELAQEKTLSFAEKKKMKLKVATERIKNEDKEINSSDKVKKVNKEEQLENTINNSPFRNLIFAPQITESMYKRHLTITYRGLNYAKKCLKEPSLAYIKSKLVNLVDSKPTKLKTLLLDLDETIVHTSMIYNGIIKENADHILKTIGDSGEELVMGLNIRPYCIEFLEKMMNLFEIFVFTASSPNYANSIVNFLDPSKKLINGILTRNNCMQTKNGFFIKDLRIINNRELKNMIIVDNLAHSFGFQIDNGVPILEFHNDKKDKELKYLGMYLTECFNTEDVREFNKKHLKLNELSNLKIDEINNL